MVKYVKYVVWSFLIVLFVYVIVAILSSADYAKSVAIIIIPLALWSGRLIVALKMGVITRRMPMLDGGAVRQGVFWSFRPDVYIRSPGFDNFKGYIFKEIVACLIVWLLFLSPTMVKILNDYGINV